ncbi:MAG: manganese efflux pump [Deltaproteobacteria bacterium]|nr:manganese efflux pump [Deltaproteobacteria bacterium]
MDAFAVATAISAALPEVTVRQRLRLAWHFGLFQALMPVLGWLGGSAVADRLGAVDHWIAFGLLTFLGVRMIRAREEGRDPARGDPTRGWTLLALSLATSIDALAVGLSLGVMEVPIVLPSVVIGLVCAVMTLLGTVLGARVGVRLRRQAARVGGAILVLIGVRILVEHLSAGGP